MKIKHCLFLGWAAPMASLVAACAELPPLEGETSQDIFECPPGETPYEPCYQTSCGPDEQGAPRWVFSPLPAGTACNILGTCDANANCVMPFPTPPDPPPEPPGPRREMTTGRLANLAVSGYYTMQLGMTGPHTLRVRAACSEHDETYTRCDPGLLVSRGTSSWYNDNDPASALHGTGRHGSYVEVTPFTGTGNVTYDLRVFSQRRATSHTTVAFSIDNGVTWTPLTTTEVGGAVVRVGTLAANDFLEVQSRTNGTGDEDTTMTLFSPEGSTARPVTFSDDRTANDKDPKLTVAAAWPSRDTMVLIGKKARVSSGNAGVETHVDLVHGPLASGSVSRATCAGGCGADLQPGSYLLSLFASTTHPIGALGGPTGDHPASKMPWVIAPPEPRPPGQPPAPIRILECPSVDSDGHSASDWLRGQPDNVAMTIQIEKVTAAGWTAVGSPRAIPRGAFGADPSGNLPFSRFALPLELTEPGTYRIAAVAPASDVSIYASWTWERNPEASELTAVTYNTLFRSEDWDTNKYKNAADLLGTRGTVIAAEGRVEERPEQAPFQWDADILGFQEVIKEHDDNTPGNRFTNVMRDELLLRGSSAWSYAQGRGETWIGGFEDGPGMNPLFVRANGFPSISPDSVFFSAAAKTAAGCRGSVSGFPGEDFNDPYYNECALNSALVSTTNHATAAKASAWRGGTGDRPIAVFNVHLKSSEGEDRFDERLDQVNALMGKIDAFLAADHRAFNNAAETDPLRASPRHGQNRAIIMGDWNIRAHECGEHYWLLRKLRARYGYAIDVSMAHVDSTGSVRGGMHVGNDGYNASDVPRGFQHPARDDERSPPGWLSWTGHPDRTSNSAFPWWATDFRGRTSQDNGASDRFSMIVLIGQGWANDDPVTDYEIMSDVARISPMNPLGRGVEMWQPDTCDDKGSIADDDVHGYAPNYGLKCLGGTGRGRPALHSDHRPMRARLRVWGR